MHEDTLAIASDFHDFAFPAVVLVKVLGDLLQGFRKFSLQQGINVFSDRFVAAQTVKPFRSVVPIKDAAFQIADHNRVVGQVELFGQHFRRAPALSDFRLQFDVQLVGGFREFVLAHRREQQRLSHRH